MKATHGKCVEEVDEHLESGTGTVGGHVVTTTLELIIVSLLLSKFACINLLTSNTDLTIHCLFSVFYGDRFLI